ncbi:MAG: Gfo/Idh/MocA family oxidoreductase [Bryobacteraceae bacterium]|nr:Gfo/Idh/MocA family oxidoreductase [Bryobacteraceae bacterium]
MIDKPLRGGICGCGFFGRIQLDAWNRMPEAEIVAACDPDLQRARAAAPSAYSSAEEMLENEELDFLDIATRPDSHLPLARLAAARKLPAICQKPMAPNWADALTMVETAERAGARLMIHENWRWQPWYREAQRRIARGDIGRPVSYSFRVRQRDGLGPAPYPRQPYFSQMPRLLIYETLVHQIDTARFLFGELDSVFAQARRVNPAIQGEDQAALVLTHLSGVIGTIDAHRFAEPVPAGPAMGDAIFDGDEASLTVKADGEIFAGDRRVWSPPQETGYKGDSVLATQRHFIERVRSGEAFESEGREYLKTFDAVESAYESVAQRATIFIRRTR